MLPHVFRRIGTKSAFFCVCVSKTRIYQQNALPDCIHINHRLVGGQAIICRYFNGYIAAI